MYILLQILPAGPSDGAGQSEQTNEGVQEKLSLGKSKQKQFFLNAKTFWEGLFHGTKLFKSKHFPVFFLC